MNAVPLILFFVSGATSLVGEIVWMRMLGLVLGNTVWSAAAVVTAWMAGMALGARLGGWLAPRIERHLRWYGAIEAGIGLCLLSSPVWLRAVQLLASGLTEDLAGRLAMGLAGRFMIAVGVLLVPTVLMGVTLPLLVERLRGRTLAGRVAVLYGVNTLGAVLGVALAAYALLPTLGETGSLSAAALACGVVAAVGIGIEQHVPQVRHDAVTPSETPSRPAGGYLLLVGAMGLSALAAEMVWVRVLVLHLGSRVYAFALLLAVYLAGIALGSTIVRAMSRRIRAPRRALALVQVLTALAIGGQLVLLGRFGGVLARMGSVASVDLSFAALQLIEVASVAVVFLPVTLLFGAAFPLAAAADPASATAGEHAGRVAAANTVGGILGALLAPVALLPVLGVQTTLLVLAVVHIVVAAFLMEARQWRLAVPLVLCLTIALALPPDWVLRRAAMSDERASELIHLEESLTATVLVKRYDDPEGSWKSLELNGVNVAGTSPQLLAVQQLQGHLPLLQHPDPKTILHVGFGSGGTCWAVSRHPVETIDVVDISPEVPLVADRYFADVNHHVLDDPRVRMIINDGRNYLLATDTRYDAILSDSIHPVFAGNGALYTVEYFRLCRRHLNPGGVVSMWLPLYSLTEESYLRILSAFHEVFPRTAVWYDVSVLNAFTVVTGAVEPGPVRVRWEAVSDPRLRASLSVAGIRSAEDLGSRLVMGPGQVSGVVGSVPPHTDDLPYVEYVSGRLLHRKQSWFDNMVLVLAFRARSDPFADPPFAWGEAAARRDELIRTHARQLKARMAASR